MSTEGAALSIPEIVELCESPSKAGGLPASELRLRAAQDSAFPTISGEFLPESLQPAKLIPDNLRIFLL
jgi:hypothetical protein